MRASAPGRSSHAICPSAKSHIVSSKAGTRRSRLMLTAIFPSAPHCSLTSTATYLLEVLRDRVLYPELKAHAISQAEKHKPDTILIEEAGLGRTLVKDLKAAGLPAVGVVPEGDKLTRVTVTMIRLMLLSKRWPTNLKGNGMAPHLKICCSYCK
jgi:Terminase RNaseH-like domain